MAGYRVDLAELDACVGSLARLEAFVAGRLEDVEDRVRHVQAAWSGDGADAQWAAHREWATGFERMQAGLVALRRASATAHSNYAAAVAANAKMWP